LALALKVGGLMNVQYAIQNGVIFVLEVNPRALAHGALRRQGDRASRRKIAARIMAGESLASFDLKPARFDHVGVKEAGVPFARFPGVVTVLGPEMKSTGEVMGLDAPSNRLPKSQLGGGSNVPRSGTVFVSVRDGDKPRILDTVKLLEKLGFKVAATGGTQRYLSQHGVRRRKSQQSAGGPSPYRRSDQEWGVQLVFNTTDGVTALADSRSLRQAALLHKVHTKPLFRGPSPRAGDPRRLEGTSRCRAAKLFRRQGLKLGRTPENGLSLGTGLSVARRLASVRDRRFFLSGSEDTRSDGKRSR